MFLDNSDAGMTKDQYLRMVEQTGEEIDWDRCPPEAEDFPDIVLNILNIFNSMGSRVYPDIGYIGKDYTTYEHLLERYGIEEHQKDYTLDLVLWLDNREITESQRRMKAEYDKIKRK